MNYRSLLQMTVALIAVVVCPANAQVVPDEQLTPMERQVLGMLPPGAHAVRIEHWPGDVPCSSLQHDPDGSWDLKDAVFVGTVVFGQQRMRNTADTKAFEQKCDGKSGGHG
jgi:hypothetical protein